MSSFKRGINPEFIEALNREYQRGSWWRKIVEDPELYIALRWNYLNVYYKGNALFLIKHNSEGLIVFSHYKYILHPNRKLAAEALDGVFSSDSLKGSSLFIKSVSDLNLIKKASEPYAGTEKKGIYQILQKNPNIVDVEIALTEETEGDVRIGGEPEDSKKKQKAPRIDFAALQEHDGYIELVFFEAKDFKNSHIRAGRRAVPKVISPQLRTYEKLINQKSASEIIPAYVRAFEDIKRLKGVMEQNSFMFDQIVKGKKSFRISKEPKLVIFGFDADQKEGKNWIPHRQKLIEALGASRVLLKGDAKGFAVGISKNY